MTSQRMSPPGTLDSKIKTAGRTERRTWTPESVLDYLRVRESKLEWWLGLPPQHLGG